MHRSVKEGEREGLGTIYLCVKMIPSSHVLCFDAAFGMYHQNFVGPLRMCVPLILESLCVLEHPWDRFGNVFFNSRI